MKKLLLVDDNKPHLDLLGIALLAAGFRVLKTDRGEAAMALASREAPDLVILDLSMPGLSGWAVCRALRALPRFKTVPIVAVTAFADLEDTVRKPGSGFDDCLIKPIDPDRLIALIRRLLGEPPPAGS